MNTPVFFSFDLPFANDSLRLSGRALCVEEFGKVWMYGVNPGMICGEGSDIPSAYSSFQVNLLALAIDTLEEVGENDPQNFKDRFVALFQERFDSTNEENLTEWEAARAMVRAGDSPDTGDLDLRREKGEAPVGVRVIRSRPVAKRYQHALQVTKGILESKMAANTDMAFAA